MRFKTISPHLDERNSCYAINCSGSCISNKTLLAIALWWLANGSYVDLCFARGLLSQLSLVRDVFFGTQKISGHSLRYFGLPINDTEKLDALSKGFYNHSGGILDGCVLAMDGFAVLTWQPYEYEVVL
jgi:hypothetical protein